MAKQKKSQLFNKKKPAAVPILVKKVKVHETKATTNTFMDKVLSKKVSLLEIQGNFEYYVKYVKLLMISKPKQGLTLFKNLVENFGHQLKMKRIYFELEAKNYLQLEQHEILEIYLYLLKSNAIEKVEEKDSEWNFTRQFAVDSILKMNYISERETKYHTSNDFLNELIILYANSIDINVKKNILQILIECKISPILGNQLCQLDSDDLEMSLMLQFLKNDYNLDIVKEYLNNFTNELDIPLFLMELLQKLAPDIVKEVLNMDTKLLSEKTLDCVSLVVAYVDQCRELDLWILKRTKNQETLSKQFLLILLEMYKHNAITTLVVPLILTNAETIELLVEILYYTPSWSLEFCSNVCKWSQNHKFPAILTLALYDVCKARQQTNARLDDILYQSVIISLVFKYDSREFNGIENKAMGPLQNVFYCENSNLYKTVAGHIDIIVAEDLDINLTADVFSEFLSHHPVLPCFLVDVMLKLGASGTEFLTYVVDATLLAPSLFLKTWIKQHGTELKIIYEEMNKNGLGKFVLDSKAVLGDVLVGSGHQNVS